MKDLPKRLRQSLDEILIVCGGFDAENGPTEDAKKGCGQTVSYGDYDRHLLYACPNRCASCEFIRDQMTALRD